MPAGAAESLFRIPSSGFTDLLSALTAELHSIPGVSLLSFSTITTLWSASRGIAGIRSGIETIYGCPDSAGYVAHRLRSLLVTILFILFLSATAGIILFGDLLGLRSAGIRFSVFSAVLTVSFTAIYAAVAKRSDKVRHEIRLHLPGAVFSTAGWIIFSWGYSLYIHNFPSATTVYGSLAAICLIMLWLYFCMMILLLGAEVNKLYFALF